METNPEENKINSLLEEIKKAVKDFGEQTEQEILKLDQDITEEEKKDEDLKKTLDKDIDDLENESINLGHE